MSLLKHNAQAIVYSHFVIACLTLEVHFWKSAGSVPMLFSTNLLAKRKEGNIERLSNVFRSRLHI